MFDVSRDEGIITPSNNLRSDDKLEYTVSCQNDLSRLEYAPTCLIERCVMISIIEYTVIFKSAWLLYLHTIKGF